MLTKKVEKCRVQFLDVEYASTVISGHASLYKREVGKIWLSLFKQFGFKGSIQVNHEYHQLRSKLKEEYPSFSMKS